MATAQPPAAPPTVRRGVEPLRAGQGSPASSGASCTRCSASSPSAHFCSSTCSRTSRPSKAPSPTARRSSSSTLPLVRVLEWVFIFLPILYHGIYGVYIWLRGKSNIVYYPWAGNWMYLAQRYTGLIAFAYIAQHVLRQRFWASCCLRIPMPRSTRCRWSWPIPGCSPSTSSP
jgi:succinate dehydrogenase / fumarate reductase cytochrome b subunit